jgi:hypothetical protein
VRYRDAAAFRQALERQLRERAAGEGARLARHRMQVAFVRSRRVMKVKLSGTVRTVAGSARRDSADV